MGVQHLQRAKAAPVQPVPQRGAARAVRAEVRGRRVRLRQRRRLRLRVRRARRLRARVRGARRRLQVEEPGLVS